jgi:hypothetical protein
VKGADIMAKKPNRQPKATADLLEQHMIDAEVKELVYQAIAQSPRDCYIVVRLPSHLLARLAELDARRRKQSLDN